jgi:hypothetical protein
MASHQLEADKDAARRLKLPPGYIAVGPGHLLCEKPEEHNEHVLQRAVNLANHLHRAFRSKSAGVP